MSSIVAVLNYSMFLPLLLEFSVVFFFFFLLPFTSLPDAPVFPYICDVFIFLVLLSGILCGN